MSFHGRTASVQVDGSTVSDLYNWSINLESNPIEQSVFGDTWGKVHGLGVNKWSGSFEGIMDGDDTDGQLALVDAQINSTVVSGIQFNLDSSSYYQGDVYITSHEVSTDPEDVARITYNFSGTGELAYSG